MPLELIVLKNSLKQEYEVFMNLGATNLKPASLYTDKVSGQIPTDSIPDLFSAYVYSLVHHEEIYMMNVKW